MAKIGELWPRRSPGAPKYCIGCKNCNAFLYRPIFWPSAMKFGSVWDLANGHLGHSPYLVNFDPRSRDACGDMHQSFTDALVIGLLTSINKWQMPGCRHRLGYKQFHPVTDKTTELYRQSTQQLSQYYNAKGSTNNHRSVKVCAGFCNIYLFIAIYSKEINN